MTRTSSLKVKVGILRTISGGLMVGPLAAVVIRSLSSMVSVERKVALCSGVMVALILTLVAVLTKYPLRCRLWIVLIGAYICLDAIMPYIVAIAACQTVDELAITPMLNHCRRSLTISKEVDRR